MKLPSKETPYSSSTLALFTDILQELQNEPATPLDMYNSAIRDKWSITEFHKALSLLYALGAIDYDTYKGVIRSASGDSL